MANTNRFYSFSIVSYANFDELKPLLEECSQFFYIYHNRDITDLHYHIVCTFKTWKTFKAVKNLVVSPSNTFVQELQDLEGIHDYLSHEHEDNKAIYTPYEYVYSDKEYWKRRLKNNDTKEDPNDMFVNDLLADDMSLEFMARKYGRDFIRNHKNYLEFRRLVLLEKHYD